LAPWKKAADASQGYMQGCRNLVKGVGFFSEQSSHPPHSFCASCAGSQRLPFWVDQACGSKGIGPLFARVLRLRGRGGDATARFRSAHVAATPTNRVTARPLARTSAAHPTFQQGSRQSNHEQAGRGSVSRPARSGASSSVSCTPTSRPDPRTMAPRPPQRSCSAASTGPCCSAAPPARGHPP